MSLKETIQEKWLAAFKAGDKQTRFTYEMVKQRITIAEKAGQAEHVLTDAQVIDLIVKEIKEREDVLQYYKPEDEAYINAVAAIEELKQYLPKPLTEEEVVAIIHRIRETESNVGKIIGLTVKEVGASFDKSKIAVLVKSTCENC